MILLSITSVVYSEEIELPSPPNIPTLSKSQLKTLITKTAKKHKVELALVKAIVMSESAYDPHAVSPKGAIGLMQIMPTTASDYGVDNPNDLFDPVINVNTGIRHLKRLVRKYKGDYARVIPAYNAGEGVVDRTNNNVTYDETIKYTAAAARNYKRYGGKRKINAKPPSKKLHKGNYNPSLLSLSIKTTLPPEYLDPGLLNGGKSRPMFVLESPKRKK